MTRLSPEPADVSQVDRAKVVHRLFVGSKPSIWTGDRVIADVGRSDSWRAREGLTSSRDRRGRDEHTSAQPNNVCSTAVPTPRDAARRSADAGTRRENSPQGWPREDRRGPSVLAAKHTSIQPASAVSVRGGDSRTPAGGRRRLRPGSESRARCGDGACCTTRVRSRSRVASARGAAVRGVDECIRASCCE